MGKGDQRTKRGKINAGTFGKVRPAKIAAAPAASKSEDKAEKAPKKKTK